MERPDQQDNNVLSWLILGYLCSHPDAKDTVAGIGKWWLPSQGTNVERQRVMDALEYLDQRGWLTTRGVNCAFKVYGLNKDRRSALQQFLSAQGRDAEVALIQDAMPTV